MSISREEKKEIITELGKNEVDSGSTEVQVGIMTHRIRVLTEHLKSNKKDRHTRRGLVRLVSKRKKLLKYLIKNSPNSYVELIKKLGIRG
ncbi:MAG: 30S ribosomal protein S15 [Rickettsiales bacterium]|nr:30S ribosomal protein S15 [Rickettsiales bacterium]|tara:strand:+ start:507 stop:776 length:270 start_codon:yes stop_codon:yes gene_type:complete